MIRFLRLLAVFVLAGVMLAPQAPAQAASGACTSANGVTVVVSFGSLGGGTVVRCVNASGSGLDALHTAGFSTTGTQRDGAGFVCRINGKPGAGDENCVNTPPTSSSWRYWYAANGGSWKYSPSGAGNRKVAQGGFEGWSFGGSSIPGYAPKRVGSTGSSGSAASSDSSGSTDGSVLKSPSSTGDTTLPKPKPRTQKTAAVPSDEAEPTDELNSKPVAAEDSGGSAGPWVAGGVLLALLIGVVATQARRTRRRTG